MRRLPAIFYPRSWRAFSSCSPPFDIPISHSFLQPTLFPLNPRPPSFAPTNPIKIPQKPAPPANNQALESQLRESLENNLTDEAWKSFKSLTSDPGNLPSRQLCTALISHLISAGDLHNLKRAFASAVLLLEKSPKSLDFDAIAGIFRTLDSPAPGFALIRTMLKNRFFPPYHVWGGHLIKLAMNRFDLEKFVTVLEEASQIPSMNPDLSSCNEILAACCRHPGSAPAAERVVRVMSAINVPLDEESFAALAFVYAVSGLQNKIKELESMIKDRSRFHCSLIRGYLRSMNIDSAQDIILRGDPIDEETCAELSKFFADKGRINDLVKLIQESRSEELGFGLVNALVNQGMVNAARSVVEETTAGAGAYAAVLRAYCKEKRTAEAAELAAAAAAAGLRLDAACFDAMIEVSMTTRDYRAALTLFRSMREAGDVDLKTSYLTIMTGLMESQRPELMAGFLDSVVDDPRVDVAAHDWNSIIHAFCKAGKLDDARRTYRRMVFLQFEPGEQTFLSLINGYVAAEKYFGVVVLWSEARRKGAKLGQASLDGFLYALVKGGFFGEAMQVVEKAKEMKVFVDKWRHKQAFMENHKKLRPAKLRRRNFRKMEALLAFKAWAGLAT